MASKIGGWTNFLLRAPFVMWSLIFFLLPFAFLVITSCQSKGILGDVIFDWSFEAYKRVFDVIYLKVYLKTLVLAISTAALCGLTGLPMAWFIFRTKHPALKKLLLFLVLLPFLTSFVARAYAVKFLLGFNGPMHHIDLLSGSSLIYFGMVTNYLPFFILPVYAALDQLNPQVFEAAKDLGANLVERLTMVLLPMLRKPIINGIAMVFVPAMGEFVIPDLMGRGKTMYLGNLVTEQFLRSRDWPFGSALAVSSLIMTLLIVWISTRAIGRDVY